MLDAILTASDRRNDELGGNTIATRKTEDYGYVHDSHRRAVYWPVLRNSLPEIFEAFDFADPSLPSGSRAVSTVAPQSLFFLNNGWVATQARSAAQRILDERLPDDKTRVAKAFQITLGRAPTSHEERIALDTVSDIDSAEDAWTMIIKALFASIDFRYVE